ncbi:MAG: UDP-2,3-diacylglucosamine diphosphatase LpxI [bacterium]
MTLAIIAGTGALPAALVDALPMRPYVVALDGFLPDTLIPDLTLRLERLLPALRHLSDLGITEACFAGAVRRPRLDPSLFDPATAQLVPRMLTAMQSGDDATLREFMAIFEEEGFHIEAIPDLAPDLLPGPGLLEGRLTPQDEADARRAAAIVDALGAVDVGQGAVVAEGQCLAVEALPGTDAMLAYVATLGPRPTRGLFYKATKPGQDRRIDLPTIGPSTMAAAAAAGLGGVAFAAGSVICLDLPQMQAEARSRGLFLWSRPC